MASQTAVNQHDDVTDHMTRLRMKLIRQVSDSETHLSSLQNSISS